MADMSGFIHLLSLGANAILTLEGQNTTCADIFYAWVCIAYHLEQVLASPDVGVTHYQDNVLEIYNRRFTQMMEESSHKIFLLTYYLHPCESPTLIKILQHLLTIFCSIPSSWWLSVNDASPRRGAYAHAGKVS